MVKNRDKSANPESILEKQKNNTKAIDALAKILGDREMAKKRWEEMLEEMIKAEQEVGEKVEQ